MQNPELDDRSTDSLLAEIASLKAENEQMRAEFARVEHELRAASALQISLLPTVSEIHPNFCLDWLVLPSSYLAGDNLNYFMMQDRYLIFYQLDVAGHGIASALLSVTLNQLLSPQPGSPMVRFDPALELKRIVAPADVVSELNRRFVPQGDGYFTMIYGILDTHTREIRLCQAGHPSPIKFLPDGSSADVGSGGFPVGLWPDMTYDEEIVELLPGERMLLYTDGILACLNPEGEPYPVERLQMVVAGTPCIPVHDTLQAVKADLELWSGVRILPDDISMLLLVGK